MSDDPKSSLGSVSEPYFEPIGPGADSAFEAGFGDDDGIRRRTPVFREAALAGAAGWLAGLATLRFWGMAVGTLCAAWAGVAGLVLLPGPAGESTQWLPAPVLTYLLASSILPAAAALAAVHWGISACRRPAGGGKGARVVTALVTAGLQGLVIALLILGTLLVQAGAAGQPGSVAGVSAGVAAAEGFIFGSMGAAVGAIGRRTVLTRITGWALALFLVAGTVAAGAALVPVVRADEPVTVALNIERAPDGTVIAYQCSAVSAGLREVYHTDRIMWLPAISPSVVFVMLAGAPGDGAGLLGWLSAALQEAADGTRVPCVNGEPRSTDAPGAPLAVVGLVLQTGVAGVLLGWAHAVTGRRPDKAR